MSTPISRREARIAEAWDLYERELAATEAMQSGVNGAVTLRDHFSATISLRIAEPQPHLGLVQLNATRGASNELISCDVKREDFIAAIETVLNVEVSPSPAPDSPSASGTPAEVDGQSSGPKSARADSVGGAS